MNTAMETVNAFYEAFGRKDLKKLREVLAPDFTFKGPLMSFNNPDTFVQTMASLPFEATVEDSRFVVDGNRVAHAYLWKMTAPAKADIPMSEFFEISGKQISSIQLFYDSKLFPAGGGQS